MLSFNIYLVVLHAFVRKLGLSHAKKLRYILNSFLKRQWSVIGGDPGLSCNETNQTENGTEFYCKNLIIPDCVDRTVYCSDPPSDPYVGGSVTVVDNPSPYYKKAGGCLLKIPI